MAHLHNNHHFLFFDKNKKWLMSQLARVVGTSDMKRRIVFEVSCIALSNVIMDINLKIAR